MIIFDDERTGDCRSVSIDNTPEGYTAFDDPRQQRADPVMQRLKASSLPVIWNQDTYTQAGAGEMWEDQAPWGFASGITTVLHLPNGKHFVFGIEGSEGLPKQRLELSRMVADVQLMAVHAQEAMMRIVVAPPSPSPEIKLSSRELEALKWTMEGKTAWEVGGIMAVSERTAVHYLQVAMKKLDAVNKHQAAIKALRMGFL